MDQLQTLDGAPLDWPTLHERVRVYYEEHDAEGYPLPQIMERQPAREVRPPRITVAELLLALMEEGREYTVRDLATLVSCSHHGVYEAVLTLESQRAVVWRPSAPSSRPGPRPRLWRLTEAYEAAS